MGTLTTDIVVNVSGAGEVADLAANLKTAALEADKLQESLRGGLGLDGIGKASGEIDGLVKSVRAASKELASSLSGISKASQDAVAGIKAAADEARTLAGADKAVADSGKAAADAQKALGDASAAAAKPLTGAADAGKAVADASKGISDASPAAAAGLKEMAGTAGDAAKTTADAGASLAALRKEMADSAAFMARSQAETAAVINRSQMSIARGEKDLASVQVTAAREAGKARRAAAEDSAASAGRAHNVILGMAGAAAYGIWKAAQLQTQVTRLYTSAGESQKNLPMMTQGILALSGQTATSQSELASGAYMIESGGYHGAAALQILRAAAQGAKAEGAPLGDVGNALTSLMTSYGMKPQDATAAMNQIITMVGSGKMKMAGAVSALPQVLPVGAAARLSFGQVGGALATMTQAGMSPDQAAQDLRHTIGSLQGTSGVQNAEMYQLGLDPVKLSANLGRRGLTGTIADIQAAVKAHTDKSGLVHLDTMNASKAATADALVMLRQMPPALRDLGRQYLDNQITQKQWIADLKGEPPLVSNLGHQFATTANSAHGFNAALKAGQPEIQTSSAALQKLLGGTVGLQTYLMLSGQHLKTFDANAAGVSAAARDAGTSVKGWADIQKTFNFQLDAFKYSSEAAATTVGTALLPAATGVMKGLAGVGSFLAGHKQLTVDLAIAGGGLALIEAGKKLASPLATVLGGVGKIGQALKIPGLDKLAMLGKGAGLDAAATGLSGSATALDGAASALEGAAGALKGAAIPGGVPGEPRPREGTSVPGVPGTASTAEGAATAASDAEKAGGLALGARIIAGGSALLRGGIYAAAADLIARGAVSLVPKASPDALKQAGTGGFWGDLDRKIFGGGINNVAADINKYFSAPVRNTVKDAARDFLSGGPSIGQQIQQMIARQPPPTLPPGILATDTVRPGAPVPSPELRSGSVSLLPAALHGWRPEPVKVPVQVDTASMAGISSKLRSLTNIDAPKLNMSGVIASVSAGMSSAASAARTGAGQVASAVSEIGSKVRSVTASFAGGMAAAGASLDAGLASGISANQGAVVGAATAVANAAASAMRSALKTSSPSKVAITIGEQTVQGLVIGLMGGQPAVDAAANALGKAAVPQDITSIVKATAQIVSLISQAVAKHEIPRSEGTFLTRALEKDQAKLEGLARRRAALEQEIQNAGQITTSAIAQGSVMNAVATTQAGPAAAQSPDEIVSGMQQQAASAKQFASELTRLQKGGLNATSVAEIAQAGPQAGLATAQGIDAGGKAAIASINQYEGQIIKAGQQLGDIGGPAMYQSGVDIAKGTAAGLKSQLSAVDASMQQVAKQMLQSLKQVLGGSGAGSAGYQIGQQIAAGIAAGIAGSASSIAGAVTSAAGGGSHGKAKPGHHAAHATAHVHGGPPPAYYGGAAAGYSAPEGPPPGPPPGYGLPGALPFGGGYHGGAPVQHHHHTTVHVHGNVTSEGDLATRLQSIYLQRAGNNMSTGLRLPGRAA